MCRPAFLFYVSILTNDLDVKFLWGVKQLRHVFKKAIVTQDDTFCDGSKKVNANKVFAPANENFDSRAFALAA